MYDYKADNPIFRFKVADLEDHSALIKQTVDGVKEYEEDKIIITVNPATIVIIENWLEYRFVDDKKEGNDQKYFIAPLPLFRHTFPFIVCTGYESINIVNIKTMQMQKLIDAPCKNIRS